MGSKTVKKLEYCHDPLERALNCSVAFNIHINRADEGYGGTPSLRCMIGEEVVFHSTKTATVTWLCGLHLRATAVLSLLKSEGIDFADKDAAIRSLSETVQAKANKEFYIKYILPVAGDITT